MQRIKQRDLHDAECVLNFAHSMLRKNNEKECSNMNQDNNGSSCAGEICLGKGAPSEVILTYTHLKIIGMKVKSKR